MVSRNGISPCQISCKNAPECCKVLLTPNWLFGEGYTGSSYLVLCRATLPRKTLNSASQNPVRTGIAAACCAVLDRIVLFWVSLSKRRCAAQYGNDALLIHDVILFATIYTSFALFLRYLITITITITIIIIITITITITVTTTITKVEPQLHLAGNDNMEDQLVKFAEY
jgi:hypothetical protein